MSCQKEQSKWSCRRHTAAAKGLVAEPKPERRANDAETRNTSVRGERESAETHGRRERAVENGAGRRAREQGVVSIRSRAPELDERTTQEWTASPRTFERFTGRPEGCVGGIPRRAGLDHYLKIGPQRIAPNFALVGDSVFPGQSILATALGGVRVAEMIARSR